jgi:hypothetical protein
MRTRRRSGFSLVLVLAMVVLVTVAVVALFSQARMQLRSTAASTAALEVEGLVWNAATLIVSDLRAEMLAGSDHTNRTGNFLSMRPATNTSMRPSRVVAPTVEPDADFSSLIKQSLRGRGTYPDDPVVYPQAALHPAMRRAGAVSSSEPSANGRTIPVGRWNAARLVTGAGFAHTNQVPDWIFFAQGGVLEGDAVWKAAFARQAADNPDRIVGRVAFNIYAIGGLLDANTAGFPAALGTNALARIEGTLAGADLSQIGLSPAQAGSLITWRNPAPDYAAYVLETALTNGFRDPHAGLNRAFAGRRDLIKFAEDQGMTNALPHLTHFSREKNSPSFGPLQNASALGGDDGGGNVHAYRDNALSTNSVNPFLPSVRRPSALSIVGYRDDGSAISREVEAGEPLLRNRFSLARLKWITPAGPASGLSDAAILAGFGLAWDSADEVWEYRATDSDGKIKTLRQVADEGRDPNFFELLQAGILSGSLGRDNGGYWVNGAPDPAIPHQFQSSRTLQVLTIGANLIDQYDADSFPTVIRAPYAGAAVRLAGSESLPYLLAFKDITGVSPQNPAAQASYLAATLWNPYREETPVAAADTPKVRIRVQGGFQQDCAWCPSAGSAAALFWVRVGALDASLELEKSRFADFLQPAPLTTVNSTGAGSGGTGGGDWEEVPAIPGLGSRLAGLRFPDVVIDPARETLVQNACTARGDLRPQYLVIGEGLASDPFVVTLEAQTPGGRWIPYCHSSGIDDAATWKYGKTSWTGGSRIRPNPSVTEAPNSWLDSGTDPQLRSGPHRYKADPRSSRFNEIVYSGGYPDASPYFLQPPQNLEASPTLAMQATPSLFSQPDNANAIWSPASLAFNNSLAPAEGYAGPDGVRRRADYGRFPAKSWTDTAFANANRPVILNRPFRAVSEMAAAFRDEPWKALDITSAESADAALLDLFSLADEPEVRAGVWDLNTLNLSVLAAVTGDASLASAVAAGNAASPLLSRADLSGLADRVFPGNAKAERERPLRRFSASGQVRTWNLLVDMVVQAVRYPANATGFADAVVESERHYWLSLAIDRHTGEVVDQMLEPAYD